MSECNYEYGEEIEILWYPTKLWEKRVFICMVPHKDEVICLPEGRTTENATCATDGVIVWQTHRKRQKPSPPVYIPYTQETFKPHRDKWFKRVDNSVLQKVWSVSETGIYMGSASGWIYASDLLETHTHEDGTPCGTIKKESEDV